MAKISMIEVKYGRSIQPRPYESANAAVTLTLAYDAEETSGPVDDEIAGAMQRAVDHVHSTLGLTPKTNEPVVKVEASGDVPSPAKAAAKKAPAKAEEADPLAAPAKEATKAAKKAPPAEEDPFGPAPATAPKAEKSSPNKRGEAMKAISAALERLQAKGDPQGPEAIKKLVKAYVADAPFSANRVPDDSLADFMSDLDKLGR